MDNKNRIGNFTSSEVYRLTGFESRPMTPEEKKEHKKNNPSSQKRNIAIDGFDSKGHTYIEDKLTEYLTGRSSEVEYRTTAIKWGSLMELIAFELIGINYQMKHKETLIHPKHRYWAGTPDLISKPTLGEIKCYYPKKFTLLSLVIKSKSISRLKEEFPKEYWQIVSNAHITGKKRGEIIAFMPTKTVLQSIIYNVSIVIEDQSYIREPENFDLFKGFDWDFMLSKLDDWTPRDYRFITNGEIETLPYLADDSKLEMINRFEFEIPKEDLKFIESRVVDANKERQDLIDKL